MIRYPPVRLGALPLGEPRDPVVVTEHVQDPGQVQCLGGLGECFLVGALELDALLVDQRVYLPGPAAGGIWRRVPGS